MKVNYSINIKEDLYSFVFTQLNTIRNWGLKTNDINILSSLYKEDFTMLSSGKVKNYEDRMALLFSSNSKKEIMRHLDMSYNTFNNGLSKLRKKNIINKDNTINEKYLFDITKSKFTFNIDLIDEKGHSKSITTT